MKEIGQGIVGCALEEAGPRVQQGLGDLAVMASFAKPLRELLLGEGVNDLRLFDVFEVQAVRDVILGKDFLDLVRGEGVEESLGANILRAIPMEYWDLHLCPHLLCKS